MTSRERWVVYPLLFLTFGITMRDKVYPQSHFITNDMTAFGKITCSRLEVGQAECRRFTLTGRNDQDVIRLGVAPSGVGRLELFAADGDVLVTLGGDETGDSGQVMAIGPNEDIRLVVGHYGDEYGVYAESAAAGRPPLPLTLPWRFDSSLPDLEEESSEQEQPNKQEESVP